MSSAELRPDSEIVEAIALRVVELLGAEPRPAPQSGLLDAAALARELGVERDWVYDHAGRLGAIRLGGPRGRLRFDLALVKERLGGAEPSAWRAPRRRPRRPRAAPKAPRRAVESGSETAKAAGRRSNAARPDTGR